MELVYLKIKDTGKFNIDLSDVDMNFDGSLSFSYDNGKLSCNYDRRYYKELYPDNLSLTAIVGKNGTGKSTLLNFITTLPYLINETQYKSVHEFGDWLWYCVVRQGKDLYFIETTAEDFDYETYSMIEVSSIKISADEIEKNHIEKKTLNFEWNQVLYTPHFEFATIDSFPKKYCINVSSDYLLKTEEESRIGETSIENFRRKDTKRQIEFIEYLKKQNTEYLLFKSLVRDSIILIFNHSSHYNYKEVNTRNGDFYKEVIGRFGSFNQGLAYEIGRAKSGNPKDLLILRVYARLFELIYYYNGKIEIEARKEDIKSKELEIPKSFDDSVSFEKIEDLIISINEFILLNSGQNIFSEIESFIDTISVDEVEFSKTMSGIIINYEQVDNVLLFEEKILDRLKIRGSLFLFTFEWAAFSTGEKAYLNLFSRIHYGFNKLENIKKEETIMVLIDEPSTGFHPEWQKTYLNNLIAFFELKRDYQIQLLLTTHSPFVLSDFQKQDVVKLGLKQDYKIKNENTLGANIHDLLANDFFLNDSYMGEYAKNKVNSLINFLKSNESSQNLKPQDWSKKSAYQFIEAIGEPLLRNSLRELYFSEFNNEIDAEIERLQKLKQQNKR